MWEGVGFVLVGCNDAVRGEREVLVLVKRGRCGIGVGSGFFFSGYVCMYQKRNDC